MPATIACPKCQTKYKLPDSALGKPIKCKKCGAGFRTQPRQGQPQASAQQLAVKSKPQPSQQELSVRSKPQPSQKELAQFGIDGPLKRQADIFSAPPPPRQNNPLGNFVLEDPGFADVELARQEVREEMGASDGMEAILNNPYALTSNQTPKKQLEVASKPTMGAMLFSFQGRAPRRVYWGVLLSLPLVLILLVAGLVVGAILIDLLAVRIIIGLAVLALFIPFVWISLAVNVRRWHDLNKSGMWIFIGFVPIVGPVWAFIENGCTRGTVGRNDYGHDPT
jgi:uncharacterized membrane protein YhaH (DUF805 family)